MSIQDTKRVYVTGDAFEVNEYLNLGWTLINTYVNSDEGYTTMNYVLAWHKDDEPQIPETEITVVG